MDYRRRLQFGGSAAALSRNGVVKCFVPDSYFLHYTSTKCNVSQSAWVACQFSKSPNNEQFISAGDENGFIHFLDAKENVCRSRISADRSCIVDLSFVANQPNKLISISGHANVILWDIERQVSLQKFVGHDGSVRSLSVPDENPGFFDLCADLDHFLDRFATGARDGTICIWDQRERYQTAAVPYNVLEYTHPEISVQRQSAGTKRRSRASLAMNSKGVTSLIHLGQNTLISTSSSFKTGIRFWDLRYRGKTGPFRILQDPNINSSRDFGIASICLDRYSSTLFVASTDSKVYQYSVQGSSNTPVGVLQGVKRIAFNTYDFKIAASPTSDHVMFGGGDCFAVLWDLQENYLDYNSRKMRYLPYPKYTFGGHRYEVTVARFSSSGRYIATMDDSFLKVWEWTAQDPDGIGQSPELINRDRVELYELPEAAKAETLLRQLKVSASRSRKAECHTPSNAERSPFKSPFKNTLNRNNSDSTSETGSPIKKISKTNGPLSPPLSDLTNTSTNAARKLEFPGSNSEEDQPQCSSHYKHPTMNLPDFVKDRLRKSNMKPGSQSSTVVGKKDSPTRNLIIVSPNRSSNCSNMLSMEERAERITHHKTHVKQHARKSCERAHRLSVPKPQIKPGDSVSCDIKQTRPQSSSIADGQTTPKSDANKKNATQRTIDQYFNKVQRSC